MTLRRCLIALAVLVAASAAVSVQALPPDCSFERCFNNPNLVCAVPGTFHVIYCSEWLYTAPPEPTPKKASSSLPVCSCEYCTTHFRNICDLPTGQHEDCFSYWYFNCYQPSASESPGQNLAAVLASPATSCTL